MKAVIVAGVLLEQAGKYLLVQQARSRRQSGKWGPPGGKPEHGRGETFVDAALRETLEETGLSVELTGFVGLVRSGHHQEPNVFILFGGRLAEGIEPDKLRLKAGEISGGRWLSLEEIEAGTVPLRATPLAALYRRHREGKLYPLDLLQYEPLRD